MVNILYLHGWGSKFDPDNEKIVALEKLGTVHGVDLDYSLGYGKVIAQAIHKGLLVDADLVVGTSMGGYLASHVGKSMGIPYVACNPALRPRKQLKKYLGDGETYDGQAYTFTKKELKSYPHFVGLSLRDKFLFGGARGMILLDSDDELIDSLATKMDVMCLNPVFMFEGGNHRFAHMEESLRYIQLLLPMEKMES